MECVPCTRGNKIPPVHVQYVHTILTISRALYAILHVCVKRELYFSLNTGTPCNPTYYCKLSEHNFVFVF